MSPETPTSTVGYRWKLRQVMAEKDIWKAGDLSPQLAERGVVLSTAQVYRLVANVPQRLSLTTLAALCDIFSCTPNDLIELTTDGDSRPSGNIATNKRRPVRARITTP
jgi:DNA-binding Xre family transcriptional regulator